MAGWWPLLAAAGVAAAPVDLEVSPSGPVRTFEQARQIVRQMPQRGKRPVVVRIRGGAYRLEAPLAFGPEDSGAPGAPVIWEAAPNERPVFSGGEVITGWTVTTGGRWSAHLKGVAAGTWDFCQLWVNGERRYRSRWPQAGYAFVAAGVAATPDHAGKGWDRVKMFPADLPGSLAPGDEVLVFHLWHMNRHRLKAVDRSTGILTFSGPTAMNDDWANYRRGDRVIFEGIGGAALEPGEWRLDRAAGVLLYQPKPGERIGTTQVVAPRLDRLLVIRGDVPQRQWVHDLEFHGLTFRHSNWSAPAGGYTCSQAEAALGGAVEIVAGRDLVFRGCEVAGVGEYAIELRDGSRDVSLSGCSFHDLGAGGVKIGEFRWGGRERADAESLTGWVRISDTIIRSGGRLHPAACGVLIGHSPHNRVERCEIEDLYYTGISVGWSWGYQPSDAHHNVFLNNRVHQLGQAVLSDLGGIYTLGISPGTVITGNRFHDITSFDYGGWGIYFDEGSTGIVAERNWAFRCSSAGFHQHYGRDNLVRQNVFALNRDSQLMRTRAEPHRSFTFERNIVMSDGGPLLASDWSGTGFESDRNLWWDRKGKPAGPRNDEAWDPWRARGFDRNSVVADPKFRDPGRGDFRLPPGSPAAKIGFTGMDLRAAGPRTPEPGEWRAPAPPFSPAAYPPGVRASLPVAEDFEESAIGDKTPGANTYEDDGATARVADSGHPAVGRCLRFVKAAVQPQPHDWNPHLQYDTGFDHGTLVGRFILNLEPGASFHHEWRDTTVPAPGHWYTPGISLAIGPDAVLTANQVALGRIPTGEWLFFDINAIVGPGSKGRYTLTVRYVASNPGDPPVMHRSDLRAAALQRVTWWGFVAAGRTPGPAFSLDALSFSPADRSR